MAGWLPTFSLQLSYECLQYFLSLRILYEVRLEIAFVEPKHLTRTYDRHVCSSALRDSEPECYLLSKYLRCERYHFHEVV